MLRAYSRRCVVAARLPLGPLEALLAGNVDKEVRKDAAAIRSAQSVEQLLRQARQIDREFIDRLSAWLETHKDAPFFAFLHVFDPHDPYEPNAPYNTVWADPLKKEEHETQLKEVKKIINEPLRQLFGMPTRDELKRAGFDPDALVNHDQDWYDGSIRGMDVEIARLVERLRDLGLDDRTLIVFLSDHGEEFLDHGRMFHGQTVYGELTQTPREIDGPYFRLGAPERWDLVESDYQGDILWLSGRVTNERGAPIPGAVVQLWTSDEHGNYDMIGYRYHGWQRTDAEGRYRFRTMVPACYEPRNAKFRAANLTGKDLVRWK